MINGIIMSSGLAKIYNSNFTNNSGCYGGAVTALPLSNQVTTSIVVDNCRFVNNTAYDGGAMYVGWGKVEFNIANSYFEGNLATGVGSTGYTAAGGALLIINNPTVTGKVSNSTFINNTAKDGASPSGSAVSIEDTNVDIDSCVFIGNNASANGGAVDIGDSKNGKGSTVTISNCNFTNNSASLVGGTVFADARTKLTINNSNFTENKANNGSAIYNVGKLSLS